jgi:hypothetical protein
MFRGRKIGMDFGQFMQRQVRHIGGRQRFPGGVKWDDELKEQCGARDGQPVVITNKNCPSRR